MLIVADIKKLEGVFTTKDDLKKAQQLNLATFATKQDLAELREEMVTKTEFRGATTTLDGIAGELKNMRADYAAHFQKHDDIDNQLKSHEKRLDKLEPTPAVTH